MEIATDALRLDDQKGKGQAEINLLGIATRADGSVGARFSDTLKLDRESQPELDKLKQPPLHYEKEFKIVPGQYDFVLTFGQSAASFGRIQMPLYVEPWPREELSLSSIVLSRETHAAADLGLVSSLLDRTPLVAQGMQFVPFGSNQFTRSDEGFFYIQLYDPDPGRVTLRVRVLDRNSGEPRWDSGVTKLPIASGETQLSIPAAASLRLGSLGTGSYRLEVAATSSTGAEIHRTADFEIK